MTTIPSDEELVSRYVALREKVASMNKAHEEKVKPYNDAMETIANVLLASLNARGAESTKTAAGTAYLSTTHRVNVSDRDALLSYVKQSGDLSMFTNAVSKEAVEEYMEQHEGQLPPGISRTGFTKCNVRKS